MTFQSEGEDGNPFYRMYTLDLESGDFARVTPGMGKTTCGFFTPTGIIVASTHEDPDAMAKQKADLESRALEDAKAARIHLVHGGAAVEVGNLYIRELK